MILLGLGSNLSSSFGDRFENINLAISYLENSGIKIKTKLFKNCEHRIPVEGSSLGLEFLRKNLL